MINLLLTKRIIKRTIEKILPQNVKLIHGGGKNVFLCRKTAIGFYYTSEIYYRSKSRFQESYCDLAFPAVKVISFNNAFKSIKMERVYGEKYDDIKHDEIVIDRLFEFSITSPIKIREEGYPLILQHGDVKRENIIWTDDCSFVFIDLDNISYYPIFYDILHFCSCNNMRLDEICSVFYSHISEVRKVFERIGLPLDDSFLDEIFYEYSTLYLSYGNFYRDVLFLVDGDMNNYPKTHTIIDKIKKQL